MTAGRATITSRGLLAGAALTAAAVFGVYALAYDWHPGRALDGRALLGFAVIRVSIVTHAAHQFQSLYEPGPYLVLTGVLLMTVLMARGALLAGAVAVLLAGANVSPKLLKPLIAHAAGVRVGPLSMVGVGSFPSGHTTAAMALTLAALIAAPAAYRPLIALVGGLLTLAVSWAVMVLSSHLPSDVIGGYLVATFWTLLVLAALRRASTWLRAFEERPLGAWRSRQESTGVLSLENAIAALVSIGNLAVLLGVIRPRTTSLVPFPRIDFGVVGVVVTLVLAGLISGVAYLADRQVA